jgi:hypothetical protein
MNEIQESFIQGMAAGGFLVVWAIRIYIVRLCINTKPFACYHMPKWTVPRY